MLPYYRKALTEKLAERIQKNPKYSLRAFAKTLQVDASILSKVLRGERFFSESLASEVIERLAMGGEERELFLSSLARARIGAGLRRMSPAQRRRVETLRDPAGPGTPPRELTVDLFKLIADWHHFAILELTRVRGFQSDPRWIARRLGISVPEAVDAVERLKMLELIEEREGRLFATTFHLNAATPTTSAAQRRRQRQVLEKSLHSLENHPVEIRNHSARTVAIDPARIPEAKKRIEEFMIGLCDELASGEKKQVYELAVQLFPLEKI